MQGWAPTSVVDISGHGSRVKRWTAHREGCIGVPWTSHDVRHDPWLHTDMLASE